MDGFKDIEVGKENSIATVKFNRPEVRNCIRENTIKELIEALKKLAKDKEVRVIVITGKGDVFSAGADIKAMAKFKPKDAERFGRLAHRLANLMENIPKPIVSAVNGAAMGAGIDMVVLSDVAIASEKAFFGWTGINVGVIPVFGGSSRAVKLLGLKRAKSLTLIGKRLSAQEALEIGLIDEVVQHEKLTIRTKEIADELSQKPPLTLGYVKKLFNLTIRLTQSTVDKREIELFKRCFATHDTKESLKAFVEKRKPVILGK